MASRADYMRRYRAKKREELNSYQRDYLQQDDNMEKHVLVCEKWRKERMKPETREKIRQYQREYYKRRKEQRNRDALGQDN